MVLRKESFYCDRDDLVRMTDTCVIIHNMVVRIVENGLLKSDLCEEVVRLVTEFACDGATDDLQEILSISSSGSGSTQS